MSMSISIFNVTNNSSCYFKIYESDLGKSNIFRLNGKRVENGTTERPMTEFQRTDAATENERRPRSAGACSRCDEKHYGYQLHGSYML